MEFVGFGGKRIVVHEWTDVPSPKGIVQILHGMAEHASRYAELAAFLNENGYLVVADDHRGHGLTDEHSLGYAKGDMFADTVRDEAALTDYYKHKFPGIRYFILGFSYGSFLAQSYIGKYGDKIDGAIIAGSNYKKDFEVYLGSFVAHCGCIFRGEAKPARTIERLSFGAYEKQFDDREWLSVDGESNAKYHADPMCGFVCSNRFYVDFFRGLKKLYTPSYRKGLRKDLPVLLISGAEDPVGEKGKGVEKLYLFYHNAGMKSVKVVLFPRSRHEFLNEKEDRDKKWGEILQFLETAGEEPAPVMPPETEPNGAETAAE